MPIVRRYHGVGTVICADASDESLRKLDSQYRAEGWEIRLEGLPGWRRARMEGEFVWYGPRGGSAR